MCRIAFAVLLSVASGGCHRSSAPAPAAAATDYRKLSQTELVALIKDKLRNDSVTLAPDGPNRYRGTMLSPDETIKLPLEVTVEEQRIVCLSKTAAGSTRNVITPQGLQSDLQMP